MTIQKYGKVRGEIINGPSLKALHDGFWPIPRGPRKGQRELKVHRFTIGGTEYNYGWKVFGKTGIAKLDLYIRALEFGGDDWFEFAGKAVLIKAGGSGEVYERAVERFSEPDTHFQHVVGAYAFRKRTGYLYIVTKPVCLL